MTDTLNQKVVNWAMGQVGKRVQFAPGSKGECWDLAEAALKQAGAKTSNDLTKKVTANADYIWGTPIADLKDVIAGDILQYRDYEMETTTTINMKFNDGTRIENAEGSGSVPFGHDHHTSIVSANPGNGDLKVLEQNYLGKYEPVNENPLRWKNAPPVVTTKREMVEHPKKKGQKELATVETTVEVTVTGTIKAYRSIPK